MGVIRAAQLLDKPLTLFRNVVPADSGAMKRPIHEIISRNKKRSTQMQKQVERTANCADGKHQGPERGERVAPESKLSTGASYVMKLLGINSPEAEGTIELPITVSNLFGQLNGYFHQHI